MAPLWLLVSLSLLLSSASAFFFLARYNTKQRPPPPPGPHGLPLIVSFLFAPPRSIANAEPFLRDLFRRYGPIVALRLSRRPSVFIADRHLAHEALVGRGSALADRPRPLPAGRILSCEQHNINSASYGPLWRLLRRNLVSELLHPAKIRLFAPARHWVLSVLVAKIQAHEDSVVVLMESVQFAMFCLLVLMCFGEKLDEKSISEIGRVQRQFILHVNRLNVFAILPEPLARLVFRKRWNTVMDIRKRQTDLIVPLIETRRKRRQKMSADKVKEEEEEEENRFGFSYVDSLLDIRLPEEGGRALTNEELVSNCSEFLTAGTDTTATALQWIMANVVKHEHVQARLAEEIRSVCGDGKGEVKEEELQRMPYLKAVVLESLRRHPPGHFVLPHAAAEETEVGGYGIPKGSTVNFMVAEMGLDGEVWKQPMEFKPERFLEGGEGDGMDITGSREIKMMPFGVGRRICPGLGLALLHLEYFVANLVREFEWRAVEGEEVDLSEKTEFTVVMKNPLRARIALRKFQ